MPVPLSSWSTLHMSKTPRQPLPKAKPPPMMTPPSTPVTAMDLFLASSRTTSLVGKKRPRESDESAKARLARRTKSTSDAREGRSAKEREAFQRGLIAVFLPNALRESARGNTVHYNELLAHFLPTPTVPILPLPPLLPLLRALTAHVSLLTPELHSPLVSAIIALPWATGDEKLVKTFVGWAGVLVSAHPVWAKEVVGTAVKGLTWRKPASSFRGIRLKAECDHRTYLLWPDILHHSPYPTGLLRSPPSPALTPTLPHPDSAQCPATPTYATFPQQAGSGSSSDDMGEKYMRAYRILSGAGTTGMERDHR